MVTISEESDELTELKQLGNDAFGKREFQSAADSYSRGIEVAVACANDEMRSVLLYNRACSFYHLGKFAECVADCNEALSLNPKYSKALYRRALANEQLGEFAESVTDLEALCEIDPTQKAINRGVIARTVKKRDDKAEKDKEAMMASLKDLGNSLLGNFGMSLNDFKFEKDPSTGSYSVKMGNATA